MSSFIFCKIESLKVHCDDAKESGEEAAGDGGEDDENETKKFKEATKKFRSLFGLSDTEKLVNCKIISFLSLSLFSSLTLFLNSASF